ncbi:NAD-dependent succinate-semialdehyde dehydrogenase [Cytobacillus praedii]|uniref:NAD-dependent succinate-semialdehyde dehydrogenase n=1 Tax=Cytobacillus praedii TaxID=1742358 RepID=UPI002E238C68|nr:NAD-dependent succinate-semialdehyde dehydrogenase [Cytobacillus praedii]
MLYIDGKWTESESKKSFTVFNPADGQKINQVADGNRNDTKKAIEAAATSFLNWSRLTAYERSSYLYKAYEIMMKRKEELAQLMTIEQGKPLEFSRNEVQYAADFLLWYAEEAKRIYGEVIPSSRRDQRFISIRKPIGVVGAITPWNYPVSMITRKIAPALAAGCTIVLKPAEETPLCAMEVFKVFDDAGIPNGVVNLISSTNAEMVGDELINNPAVKKITFTGSTEIGKLIAEKAARNVKRVSMELGGHAPFIVYGDADPVHAAKGAALVKFLNTGQACISPNRIFVHRSIAEKFTSTLIDRVRNLRAGNGLEEGISIGPLVNEAAIEKVDGQVKNAVEGGATLELGGYRLKENGLDKGVFYAPTILSGVHKDMRIFREETFGPVAPICIFDNNEEVIEMANDTHYGLAAYVYTKDISKAMRAFEELNFGIIGINDINPTSASAPFGGMNESGLGREGGREGIAEYLETKLGGFSI